MARANQLFFLSFMSVLLVACTGFARLPAQTPTAGGTTNDQGAVATVGVLAPRAAATSMPAPQPAAAPPSPVAAPAHLASAPRQNAELLFQAIAAAGADYRQGGRTHATGFDCSGLVAFVYREAYGLNLPPNSRAQSGYGRAVGRESLQIGDLVFFNTRREPFSHVGIYIGEGKFIHAPKTGSKVRTENLLARYWSTRYDGARRIVPDPVDATYAAAPRQPAVTFP